MWYHPKYYKELRQLRNKSDQVISPRVATASARRAPGPGLKLGEMDIASSKRQASSTKLVEHQATSVKPQAASVKRQAASVKLQDS